MKTFPRLLFYCQHSVGLGHLVRSLALASGLAEHFDVVILNGGRLPEGTFIPNGVRMVNLAPLGHDESYQLVSLDPDVDVATACKNRVASILDTVSLEQPDVVVLELFPFGRKKFAFEIEPLLTKVRAQTTPLVVCSLRDILVNQRKDQDRHDERACVYANAHLDAILMHSDPHFATIEQSFRPQTPLTVPVFYTGFVTDDQNAVRVDPRDRIDRVIVSSGGGMVGGPLVRIAAAAHNQVWQQTGLRTTVVAGPFLPDADWEWLQRESNGSDTLHAIRSVNNLAGEIAKSRVSVSQGGYNTTMDLLRASTPAIVVPFAAGKEDEQSRRTEQLASLGALLHAPAATLTEHTYCSAVSNAASWTPSPIRLDLDGRRRSAEIVVELLERHLAERRA